MTAIIEFIFKWLDPIGIVIGIILAFPVFWTWWDVVFGRKRRRKKWFRNMINNEGINPSILIVNLLETKKDIKTQIAGYFKDNEIMMKALEQRCFTVERKQSLKTSDMPALIEDLRDCEGDIIEAGTDQLHVFYAGPVAPALSIGALLSNHFDTQIYQRSRETGNYENWGPLEHRLIS